MRSALEHEIETGVCLVGDQQARDCAPGAKRLPLQNWPWPLKVQTLGAFRILQDGRAAALHGESPRKPLELLKRADRVWRQRRESSRL